MKIKSILSALLLMISSVASAQYLNVKLEDGSVRSFKTTPNMKVSFGDAMQKTEQPSQIVHVNGHQVTVKLADDTLAKDVLLYAYADNDMVKIDAYSKSEYDFQCTRNDGEEVPAPAVSNGVYTFAISGITQDVAVTVEHLFLQSINGHACVRLAGAYWATENADKKNSGIDPRATKDNYTYFSESDALEIETKWGSTWNLPSEEQWMKLVNNCNWEWTSQGDMTGYKVSDKNDSSRCIFLPATGNAFINADIVVFQFVNSNGFYMASNGNNFQFSKSGKWIGPVSYDEKALAVRLVAK